MFILRRPAALNFGREGNRAAAKPEGESERERRLPIIEPVISTLGMWSRFVQKEDVFCGRSARTWSMLDCSSVPSVQSRFLPRFFFKKK